jgi:5-methylcytosine-specific restriction endonuclease McrA
MRFEIVLFVIAGFIMANIYTDGKYLKMMLTWKKYYQMAGVAFGALMLYWLFRKNPVHAHQLIATSNEYLKYLPVDKNATSMITPILDFTSRYSQPQLATTRPVLQMPNGGTRQDYAQERIMNSGSSAGKTGTKRSVSETKKKFVAAKQNWRCGHCTKQLPAWFEVDHIIRLEHNGSNHVDNLVALCRDCHGEKTAIENL